MRKFLIACILFLYLLPLSAGENPDVVTERIKSSFTDWMKFFYPEKLYIQTDKPYYIVGEDVWFRAHRVDGVFHTPAVSSPFVYVELVNPLDSVVNRVKVIGEEGIFSGYLPLPEELPEGDYTLRSYTWSMREAGEHTFFAKRVYIGSPLSGVYKVNREFDYEDHQLVVRLSVEGRQSGRLISPDEIMILNEKK